MKDALKQIYRKGGNIACVENRTMLFFCKFFSCSTVSGKAMVLVQRNIYPLLQAFFLFRMGDIDYSGRIGACSGKINMLACITQGSSWAPFI
jgi:hypothetical protein